MYMVNKGLGKEEHRMKKSSFFRLIFVFVLIYIFLVSIQLMSSSLKLFGKGFADNLIGSTSNAFVGLFIGILATSIIQSSSATTSIVVGLVAAHTITVRNAIPVVMGANIGTTVTNVLVSLGHVTRKDEFKRAFGGAFVHDCFNLLAVIILLPVELATHFLERTAIWFSNGFADIGGMKILSPLKVAVQPTVALITRLLFNSPILVLIFALVILFVSLRFFVMNMRRLAFSKAEVFLDSYIFRTPLTSLTFGMILTALVQSSSVTTSLVVPLVGAGLLTIEKIFPYTLGANIGTTVTAILASLVTNNPIAIAIAGVHLLFNLCGICIIYPMKRIPISLAKGIASFCTNNRKFAVLYILILFYIIPFIIIVLAR